VVFQDESWFSSNPRLAAGWGQSERDCVTERPVKKLKGAWMLYAARDVVGSEVHRHYAPKCNQWHAKAQWGKLLTHYQILSKRLLVVIWDNAS